MAKRPKMNVGGVFSLDFTPSHGESTLSEQEKKLALDAARYWVSFVKQSKVTISVRVAKKKLGKIGTADISADTGCYSFQNSAGNLIRPSSYHAPGELYPKSCVVLANTEVALTYNVLLHELGHCLGLGILWFDSEWLSHSGPGAPVVIKDSLGHKWYRGAGGVREYRKRMQLDSNYIYVPLEDNNKRYQHVETFPVTTTRKFGGSGVEYPCVPVTVMSYMIPEATVNSLALKIDTISLGQLEDIGYDVTFSSHRRQLDLDELQVTGTSLTAQLHQPITQGGKIEINKFTGVDLKRKASASAADEKARKRRRHAIFGMLFARNKDVTHYVLDNGEDFGIDPVRVGGRQTFVHKAAKSKIKFKRHSPTNIVVDLPLFNPAESNLHVELDEKDDHVDFEIGTGAPDIPDIRVRRLTDKKTDGEYLVIPLGQGGAEHGVDFASISGVSALTNKQKIQKAYKLLDDEEITVNGIKMRFGGVTISGQAAAAPSGTVFELAGALDTPVHNGQTKPHLSIPLQATDAIMQGNTSHSLAHLSLMKQISGYADPVSAGSLQWITTPTSRGYVAQDARLSWNSLATGELYSVGSLSQSVSAPAPALVHSIVLDNSNKWISFKYVPNSHEAGNISVDLRFVTKEGVFFADAARFDAGNCKLTVTGGPLNPVPSVTVESVVLANNKVTISLHSDIALSSLLVTPYATANKTGTEQQVTIPIPADKKTFSCTFAQPDSFSVRVVARTTSGGLFDNELHARAYASAAAMFYMDMPGAAHPIYAPSHILAGRVHAQVDKGLLLVPDKHVHLVPSGRGFEGEGLLSLIAPSASKTISVRSVLCVFRKHPTQTPMKTFQLIPSTKDAVDFGSSPPKYIPDKGVNGGKRHVLHGFFRSAVDKAEHTTGSTGSDIDLTTSTINAGESVYQYIWAFFSDPDGTNAASHDIVVPKAGSSVTMQLPGDCTDIVALGLYSNIITPANAAMAATIEIEHLLTVPDAPTTSSALWGNSVDFFMGTVPLHSLSVKNVNANNIESPAVSSVNGNVATVQVDPSAVSLRFAYSTFASKSSSGNLYAVRPTSLPVHISFKDIRPNETHTRWHNPDESYFTATSGVMRISDAALVGSAPLRLAYTHTKDFKDCYGIVYVAGISQGSPFQLTMSNSSGNVPNILEHKNGLLLNTPNTAASYGEVRVWVDGVVLDPASTKLEEISSLSSVVVIWKNPLSMLVQSVESFSGEIAAFSPIFANMLNPTNDPAAIVSSTLAAHCVEYPLAKGVTLTASDASFTRANTKLYLKKASRAVALADSDQASISIVNTAGAVTAFTNFVLDKSTGVITLTHALNALSAVESISVQVNTVLGKVALQALRPYVVANQIGPVYKSLHYNELALRDEAGGAAGPGDPIIDIVSAVDSNATKTSSFAYRPSKDQPVGSAGSQFWPGPIKTFGPAPPMAQFAQNSGYTSAYVEGRQSRNNILEFEFTVPGTGEITIFSNKTAPRITAGVSEIVYQNGTSILLKAKHEGATGDKIKCVIGTYMIEPYKSQIYVIREGYATTRTEVTGAYQTGAEYWRATKKADISMASGVKLSWWVGDANHADYSWKQELYENFVKQRANYGEDWRSVRYDTKHNTLTRRAGVYYHTEDKAGLPGDISHWITKSNNSYPVPHAVRVNGKSAARITPDSWIGRISYSQDAHSEPCNASFADFKMQTLIYVVRMDAVTEGQHLLQFNDTHADTNNGLNVEYGINSGVDRLKIHKCFPSWRYNPLQNGGRWLFKEQPKDAGEPLKGRIYHVADDLRINGVQVFADHQRESNGTLAGKGYTGDSLSFGDVAANSLRVFVHRWGSNDPALIASSKERNSLLNYQEEYSPFSVSATYWSVPGSETLRSHMFRFCHLRRFGEHGNNKGSAADVLRTYRERFSFDRQGTGLPSEGGSPSVSYTPANIDYRTPWECTFETGGTQEHNHLIAAHQSPQSGEINVYRFFLFGLPGKWSLSNGVWVCQPHTPDYKVPISKAGEPLSIDTSQQKALHDAWVATTADYNGWAHVQSDPGARTRTVTVTWYVGAPQYGGAYGNGSTTAASVGSSLSDCKKTVSPQFYTSPDKIVIQNVNTPVYIAKYQETFTLKVKVTGTAASGYAYNVENFPGGVVRGALSSDVTLSFVKLDWDIFDSTSANAAHRTKYLNNDSSFGVNKNVLGPRVDPVRHADYAIMPPCGYDDAKRAIHASDTGNVASSSFGFQAVACDPRAMTRSDRLKQQPQLQTGDSSGTLRGDHSEYGQNYWRNLYPVYADLSSFGGLANNPHNNEGTVCEVVAYDGRVTTGDIEKIEAGLMRKWGVLPEGLIQHKAEGAFMKWADFNHNQTSLFGAHKGVLYESKDGIQTTDLLPLAEKTKQTRASVFVLRAGEWQVLDSANWDIASGKLKITHPTNVHGYRTRGLLTQDLQTISDAYIWRTDNDLGVWATNNKTCHIDFGCIKDAYNAAIAVGRKGAGVCIGLQPGTHNMIGKQSAKIRQTTRPYLTSGSSWRRGAVHGRNVVAHADAGVALHTAVAHTTGTRTVIIVAKYATVFNKTLTHEGEEGLKVTPAATAGAPLYVFALQHNMVDKKLRVYVNGTYAEATSQAAAFIQGEAVVSNFANLAEFIEVQDAFAVTGVITRLREKWGI